MLLRLLLSIALLSTCVSCNIPRDPNHTLEQVSGGTIRVGVVDNEPWVKRVNGEPAGVEVTLVREFAKELGARIDWVWGSEHEHLEALKRHELDLMIAGLTESPLWQQEVGLTNPYFTNRIAVGVPRSTPPLRELKGVSVAAKRGEVVAHISKRKTPFRFVSKTPLQRTSLWQLPYGN